MTSRRRLWACACCSFDSDRPRAPPERAAGIAGGRLHPDLIEFAVAQDFAVRDAIERHAAGQAEIALRIFRRQAAREQQHRLLEDDLGRGRDVHVRLRQRFAAHRAAASEQPVEFVVGHRQAGAVVEIRHVQPERSVR